MADDRADETAAPAARPGAEVLETVGHTFRKAGALDQVLDALLPVLADDDQVLVMDAASAVVTGFLAAATTWLRHHPGTGAVGGVFTGRPGGGLVGTPQRNEFARYSREVERRRGRAMVLTGTATLFRATVHREIAEARGDVLPGRHGSVHDALALTEDNEITLVVKTLGHATASPRQCGVRTEIMPTWRDLRHQRPRWQPGPPENLRAYGLTRVTPPYVAKQVAMYLGIVAITLFLLATALFAAHGELGPPDGFWLAVTSLSMIERIWTVRARGRREMVQAAAIVVEFDLFQVGRCAALRTRRSPAARAHRTQPGAAPRTRPVAPPRTGESRCPSVSGRSGGCRCGTS